MNERIGMSESVERGRNVTLVLECIRHGVRDPAGNLTDTGREITRELARKRSKTGEPAEFDVIKAIGSPTGPINSASNLPRSLETAAIYAYAQSADGQQRITRPETRLSYETTTMTKTPYDHTAIYNGTLDMLLKHRGLTHKDFETLSDPDKQLYSHEAQKATLKAAFDTTGDEAEAWKREVAGQFADLIEHQVRKAKHLKSGSRVLVPAGTHGGSMEWILQQALVWKDTAGAEHVGLKTGEEFEEIGGAFNSSEAYAITIKTDENGEIQKFEIQFRNPERPQGTMHLDATKVTELAAYFRNLHKDDERHGGIDPQYKILERDRPKKVD